MNIRTEVFADPVELPDHLHHCGSTAYDKYGCRCRYCVIWRRMYDQMARYRSSAAIKRRKTGARDYLAHRGIQVYGPGPFRKNPLPLARLVANHFGDDLSLWEGADDE